MTELTVTTSLEAIRDALAEGRAALDRRAGSTSPEADALERALNYADIAVHNLARLGTEVEHLHADVAEWQAAASFFEGPSQCLERECDEYLDEDSNDNGIERCSHVAVVELSPSQMAALIAKGGAS